MTALDLILEQAAEARAAGMPAPASRPRERRQGETGGIAAVRASASLVLERGESEGDGLHFTGFASVYDRGYEMWDMFGPYTEQVISGAGTTTLAQEGLDVPLVLDHTSLRRIARTTNGSLSLSESTIGEDSGLHVDAPDLNPRDADVAYIVPKLEAGLIDEMSFRFRITRGEWSADWTEYHIEEYDLHRGDVAIVGYGANPYTAGSGLRSARSILPSLEDLTEADLRLVEKAVRDQLTSRGVVTPSLTFAALDAIDLRTI